MVAASLVAQFGSPEPLKEIQSGVGMHSHPSRGVTTSGGPPLRNQRDMDEDQSFPTRWKWVIGIILVLTIISSAVFQFWIGPAIFFEQKEAAHDSVEDTYNWENAKTNYEWFKNQKYDIKAKQQQANNTKAQIKRMHEEYEGGPSDWPRDVRKSHERYHQQLLGQQNMHNQMVAKYNARSEMEHRSLFKDELPYEMEKKFWTGDAR